MKKFVSISVVMLVMSAIFVGCQKDDEWMKNLTESEVTPAVVTDTIPVHDTTVVVDTAWRDSIAPGVFQIITFEHTFTGEWSVNGNTASTTATHLGKITTIENGVSYTVDSTVFTETGTMVWHFQTVYTQSIDGNWPATASGCSALSATCDTSWTYNVPEQYAPYFEGHCEQVPYLVVGNGNQVTVKTSNGQHNRQATFSVNVDIPTPDSTVVSRTAAWRHGNDYGQWIGTGASRTMTLHCWCVESTTWSTGSITKDSVLVAGHGTMTWSFPTYTQYMDGTYSATSTGCSAMNATCNVTESYDPANIQGRVYTHPASVHCVPVPTQVVVSGTTATVHTAHGNVTRNANYTIVVNIPTPADTIDIFGGHIKYWCRFYSAVNYYAPAAGDAWMYLVITDDNQWYTSPDATTAAGLNFTNRGTITASDYAYIVSVSNFTATEKSGSRCCAAWCRNSTAGATANVFSVVKYDPNSGNPQIKYRNTSGALVGVCSAASGTIESNQAVPEPVGQGGVATNFTFGNSVVR